VLDAIFTSANLRRKIRYTSGEIGTCGKHALILFGLITSHLRLHQPWVAMNT
jgi:hypothetical protein